MRRIERPELPRVAPSGPGVPMIGPGLTVGAAGGG
jgi:hypothetical protein